MIIVSETQAQAEAISEWIADALRYKRLVHARDRGEYIVEAGEPAVNLYNRLMQEDYETALGSLRGLWLSPSGKTTRWATPQQLSNGPYAGWWYIPCPMRSGEVRQEWVYQVDPLTDQPRDQGVWEGVEIVAPNSTWFVSDEA